MMQLLIEIILLGASTAGILTVALATLYDMKRLRSETAMRHDMRRMTKYRQPHVSIIITHCDSPDELRQCLRHIQASRYKRYDVVAVTGKISTHERKQLQANTRIEKFRIYSPRLNLTDKVGMKNAYKRSMRGDMIMTLRAEDFIDPLAMKKAVTLLHQDDSIDGVKLLGEMYEPGNMMQVYDIFLELSSRLTAKAFLAVGLKQRQKGVTTGIYRYQSMTTATKTVTRVAYQHSLESSQLRYRHRPWEWSDWASRLCFITVVGYVSIIAATLQSTWPLTMAWAITCIWLVVVVWSDETTRLKRKLAISTCIPIGMFVMTASYVMGGIVTIFRLKTF